MLQRTIAALCIAIAGLASAQPRTAEPQPPDALAGENLLKALRGGGLTLYFRHAATDFSQSDRPGLAFAKCDEQRNLSPAGRLEARRIGEAIAALRLPLGEVIASPYCRTMETALMVAGRAASPEEVVLGRKGPSGAPDYQPLNAILSTPPPQGSVRVVAGHGNPIRALAGTPHLAEGEALVIRSTGTSWVVVARLLVSDWERLAEPAPGTEPMPKLTLDPAKQLEGERLVAALRAGGYTLYFRHAESDLTQSDQRNFAIGDCKTQRNLSAAGRAQAARIGEVMAALGIRVGQSLASPFCRTMDTARLIAGHASVEESARGVSTEPGKSPTSGYPRLARLLASPTEPGKIRVVVGHVGAWEVLKGPKPHLQEGEAVVLQGSGDGLAAVARILASDWERLTGN